MDKIVSLDQALDQIKDGMTIMVGGFLNAGAPLKILDALAERGVKDLTLIGNDTGFVENGVGKMVVNGQFKKVVATHIGTNRETGNKMNSGEMEVELVPQGTLAERVRTQAAGLGGFLTPTGIGTIVEEGKEKITVDGQEYLLEKPIKADIALIVGHRVDKSGNIVYRGATRNFNELMAGAADIVIVEAENIVEVGELDQNHVVTPGIFVNYIVDGGAI